MKTYECIIIWAGAAGIWMALKLQEIGIDYWVLEADTIWSSFLKWNTETRFISPSFPSNAFGQVDLNSIHHKTSPGLMFKKEHVSWEEYAQYLEMIVKEYNVHVKENEKVLSIEKQTDGFQVKTEKAEYLCQYIISAIGEFWFPYDGDIVGSQHAIHSSKLWDYDSYVFENNDIIPIIWWYESSVDVASGLHKKWQSLHVFCWDKMDKITTSDPSEVLSLYSLERLNNIKEKGDIEFSYDYIKEIQKNQQKYTLTWKSGKTYTFTQQPILATGFQSRFDFCSDFVTYRPDGQPDLNSVDELKNTQDFFVVGPQVRQDQSIFCFIYKFRLRFWIVALEIAKRLGKNIDYHSIQSQWEKQGFFLNDLWGCWDECMC